MISGKYTKDYRLENVEKKGKLVTRAIYRGDWFEFVKPAEEIRKTKVLYCICSCLSALMFTGALFLNTASGHCFYVMIPFAILIFPVFYSCAALYRLLTVHGRVTREHMDKTGRRYSSSSAFIVFFSAISLVGHIIFIILNGEDFQGVLFLILTAGIFACGAVMFSQRHRLDMERTGSARDGIEFYEQEKLEEEQKKLSSEKK